MDDATGAVLSLIRLYSLDDPDLRSVLNRVAWTLRENGWGLVAGSEPPALANIVTGTKYQVIDTTGGGIGLVPVGDLDHSTFTDPVEPPALPPVAHVLDAVTPPPAPPPPLPFLKRVPPGAVLAPEQAPDPAMPPAPPGTVVYTVTDRLDAMDQKLNALVGMFDQLGHILNDFAERIEAPRHVTFGWGPFRVRVTVTADPPRDLTHDPVE